MFVSLIIIIIIIILVGFIKFIFWSTGWEPNKQTNKQTKQNTFQDHQCVPVTGFVFKLKDRLALTSVVLFTDVFGDGAEREKY